MEKIIRVIAVAALLSVVVFFQLSFAETVSEKAIKEDNAKEIAGMLVEHFIAQESNKGALIDIKQAIEEEPIYHVEPPEILDPPPEKGPITYVPIDPRRLEGLEPLSKERVDLSQKQGVIVLPQDPTKYFGSLPKIDKTQVSEPSRARITPVDELLERYEQYTPRNMRHGSFRFFNLTHSPYRDDVRKGKIVDDYYTTYYSQVGAGFTITSSQTVTTNTTN